MKILIIPKLNVLMEILFYLINYIIIIIIYTIAYNKMILTTKAIKMNILIFKVIIMEMENIMFIFMQE